MRRTLSVFLCAILLLTSSVLLARESVISGGAPVMEKPQPIPDVMALEIVGSGRWAQFFNGVACGAGIVGIAAGALSGVGTVVAIAAVTSVVATCVSAFD